MLDLRDVDARHPRAGLVCSRPRADVASQMVRLHQHDPGSWSSSDYAGRLGGVSILAVIPTARAVAFRWRDSEWPCGKSFCGSPVLWPPITIWAVGQDHDQYGIAPTVLGVYPQSSGWLNLVDVVFGLALVAHSELFSADARSRVPNLRGERLSLGFGHVAAVRCLSLVDASDRRKKSIKSTPIMVPQRYSRHLSLPPQIGRS